MQMESDPLTRSFCLKAPDVLMGTDFEAMKLEHHHV